MGLDVGRFRGRGKSLVFVLKEMGRLCRFLIGRLLDLVDCVLLFILVVVSLVDWVVGLEVVRLVRGGNLVL